MKIHQAQILMRRLSKKYPTENASRFFKTGPGQYAEHDQFLGLPVPKVRKIAKQFENLDFPEIENLLHSKFNEERLLALLILNSQYEIGSEAKKLKAHRFYLKNRRQVNNWNLVDASAPLLVGNFLLNKNRQLLFKLVRSKSLWDRRIAIVATLGLIHQSEFKECLCLSKLLMADQEDLIHKACGWMLREVGKKDVQVLDRFLSAEFQEMPRTMLRYAIERLPKARQRFYMK